MARIAVVSKDVVVAVLLAPSEKDVALNEGQTAVDVSGHECGVGFTMENGIPVPPPREPQRSFSFMEFMGLFSASEQAAILGATDTQTKLFLLMLAATQVVSLDDPKVEAGLDAFVTAKLITADRKAEIMKGA